MSPNAPRAALTAWTSRSGNRELARDIVTWAFKERGVIRSSDVRHHRVGESSAPAMYRIKDRVVRT